MHQSLFPICIISIDDRPFNCLCCKYVMLHLVSCALSATVIAHKPPTRWIFSFSCLLRFVYRLALTISYALDTFCCFCIVIINVVMAYAQYMALNCMRSNTIVIMLVDVNSTITTQSWRCNALCSWSAQEVIFIRPAMHTHIIACTVWTVLHWISWVPQTAAHGQYTSEHDVSSALATNCTWNRPAISRPSS